VFGDDFVASTVVTQRFTKRNVHVQGQGRHLTDPTRLALLQNLDVIGLAKGLDKPVRSGVRGIAWAGHVKACQQLGRNNGHGSAPGSKSFPKNVATLPFRPSPCIDPNQTIYRFSMISGPYRVQAEHPSIFGFKLKP
jgi:hypothetical protein